MALNAVDSPASEVDPSPLRTSRSWRLALAAFGLMGARLSGAVFGFLSQILLARTFAAEDVGIAFLAMSVTTFVALLITSGYSTLALTYLARYRALNRPSLVEAFLAVARRDVAVTAVVVLAGAGLGYVFAPMSHGMAEAMLAGCIAAVPLAAIRINSSEANAQRRFALSYAPDFVFRPLLLLAFIALMVVLGMERHVEYVLLALIGIAIVVAIGQAVRLGHDNVWRLPLRRPARNLARFFRHRAGAMLLVTVVGGATADLVVMLGGVFLPPDEVAVLAVAVRLAALVGFFSAASQPFVLRDLASAMSQAKAAEINRLLLRMNLAGLSLMAVAIIGCAALGPWVLAIYGHDYAAAYWPLLLFLVGQMFRVSGGMNGELLALGGHQVKSATLCVAAVVVLVAMAALLTPIWHVMGLAGSYVCAEAFWAVGLAMLTQKLEGRRGDIVGLLLQRRPLRRHGRA
jgi:O-antigen/teichoic acid export membrane protein